MEQALRTGEVKMSGTFRIFYADDANSTDTELVVGNLTVEARSRSQAIDIFLEIITDERSEILHIQRMS